MGDHIKEDEMGGACGTYICGEENLDERRLADLDVEGRVILS